MEQRVASPLSINSCVGFLSLAQCSPRDVRLGPASARPRGGCVPRTVVRAEVALQGGRLDTERLKPHLWPALWRSPPAHSRPPLPGVLSPPWGDCTQELVHRRVSRPGPLTPTQDNQEGSFGCRTARGDGRNRLRAACPPSARPRCPPLSRGIDPKGTVCPLSPISELTSPRAQPAKPSLCFNPHPQGM